MLEETYIKNLLQQMEETPLTNSCINQLNQFFFSYKNQLPASFDLLLVLASSSINRIKKAIEIYHQHPVKIIISGGKLLEAEGLLEAEKYYMYAICHGVAKDDLILDLTSQNTYENFVYAFELIAKLPVSISNIILITSANHMPRALLTGQKYMRTHQLSYQLFPVVSYATLLPKDTWFKNERAVAILKGELERILRYDLLAK